MNPRRHDTLDDFPGAPGYPARTADGSLAANEVHIWRIDLSPTSDGIQQYRSLLSADELQRADRFHFAGDRWRFTVARTAMRQILGCYLNLPARDIRFCYGPQGKPDLADGLERSGIKFNLSHSSDVGLLALAKGLEVGADVERINVEFATDDIARRFFSALEVQTLCALPSGHRGQAFFSCWTRKEAYIKALGGGLSVPLDSFAVAFAPGIPPALLQVQASPAEVERWSMYNIEPGEGYKAALVVEGQGHRLQHRRWNCPVLNNGFSIGRFSRLGR